MSRRTLRQASRMSFFEQDEPAADEYVYCELCYDFVYEYCAIHGRLLRVPDDKVPKRGYPASVPRAALTAPREVLHLNHSCTPGAGLGVFATLTLPRGVCFGPYRGVIAAEVTSDYCWQIYSGDNKPSHVMDAADPNNSNWLRYVNCARHWREQNLVAYQYRGQVYYRTIKIIPRFTELLVFYGTEFANTLNIDLSAYNKPGLTLKYGGAASLIKKRKIERENKNSQQVKIVSNHFKENKENHSSKNIIQPYEIKPANIVSDNNERENSKDIKSYGKEQNNNNHTLDNLSPSDTTKMDTVIVYVGTEDKNPENVPKLSAYFHCDTCSYRGVFKYVLEKHMRFHDMKRKFACESCGYRFKENKQLNRHRIAIHKSGINARNIHECNICENTNTTYHSGDMKHHLLKHAELKLHACNICDKKFTRAYSLKMHLMTHTADKPHKCNVCSYTSNKKINLESHVRTHTGVKPFVCNVCSYKCNNASQLKRHKRTHTGEKPYACYVCSYKCNDASQLKRHKRTHTGEKPYACYVCSYKCNDAGQLKIHKRTHTGEKPFACNVCSYKCNQAGQLKRHKRTHTGEKPYACNVCSYKCNQADHLKRHKRIHTEDKP